MSYHGGGFFLHIEYNGAQIILIFGIKSTIKLTHPKNLCNCCFSLILYGSLSANSKDLCIGVIVPWYI